MFLPGLKASTSRLPLPLLPRTTTRLKSIRYASSFAPPTAMNEEQQKQLDEHKKSLAEQERMARVMPRLDIAASETPILEPIVDPPWNPAWILNPPSKIYAYLKARGWRWWATRQMLHTLVQQDAIAPNMGKMIGRKIDTKGGPMLVEALEVYKSYNLAQAKRDVPSLRSLSVGKALQTALQTTKQTEKAQKTMNWEFLRQHKKPTIVSVRYGAIDAAATKVAAQIVVKFDSDQALTITPPRGKPTKKVGRVVEHVIFERKIPGETSWKLKDRIQPTTPDFRV